MEIPLDIKIDQLNRPASISSETLIKLIHIYCLEPFIDVVVDFAVFDNVLNQDGQLDKSQADIIHERILKKKKEWKEKLTRV